MHRRTHRGDRLLRDDNRAVNEDAPRPNRSKPTTTHQLWSAGCTNHLSIAVHRAASRIACRARTIDAQRVRFARTRAYQNGLGQPTDNQRLIYPDLIKSDVSTGEGEVARGAPKHCGGKSYTGHAPRYFSGKALVWRAECPPVPSQRKVYTRIKYRTPPALKLGL